jgi:hypothetical protein
MPRNPESKRYQSSKTRGYDTLSINGPRKVALQARATLHGYPSLQDYVWDVMIGKRPAEPVLDQLREAEEKTQKTL